MKRTNWKIFWKQAAVSMAAGWVVLLLLCGLLGWLTVREVLSPKLGETVLQVLAMGGLLALCCVLGQLAPGRRMVVTVGASAAAVLLGLLGRMLCFGDRPLNSRGVILAFCVGIAAGIWAGRKRERK